MHYRLLTLLFIFLLATPSLSTSAQKSKRVQQLERQRKSMLEEIKRTSTALKQADTSAKASLKKLNLLAVQIKNQKEVIQTISLEVALADSILHSLHKELEDLSKTFEKRQGRYVSSLRAMQNRSYAHEHLLFVLSAKDFAQSVRRARYLKDYAEWQKEEALKLKALRAEVEAKKSEIAQQKNVKTKLLASREEEQKNLQKSEEENREQIQKLQAQKKELEKILAQKRKQANELNRQIEQQIAREVAEAEEKARKEREAAAKRAPSAPRGRPSRSSATKGGYAMTQEESALSSSFEGNRGRLPAPISGRYTVVGTFGEHAHEQLKYVRVNSSGVDLQGGKGAVAKAVFNGVVTRIFVIDGFNQSIIIRHGNYLTVYSNISSVSVKTGQKVSTGQTLGNVYADPELGGATLLHFQVWKERTKLNPLQWIRR